MRSTKTLADFKRDAKSGKMRLELIESFGRVGDQIPERQRGVRSISCVNTVAVTLVNDAGQESELRYESAKLFEYTGDSLTVYNAGLRNPTQEELAVLDRAQQIRKEHENTYSGGYWHAKDYFKTSPAPWMEGVTTVKGKCYLLREAMVRDNSIRGEAVLKYKVHMN